MTTTTTPRHHLTPEARERLELEALEDELAEIEANEARHAQQVPPVEPPDPITPADGVEPEPADPQG